MTIPTLHKLDPDVVDAVPVEVFNRLVDVVNGLREWVDLLEQRIELEARP